MTVDDYIILLEENGIGLLDYQKFLIKKMPTSAALTCSILYRCDCRSAAKLQEILYKTLMTEKGVED